MSAVFFTADTHFGHRNICKYRPQFASPQEHDEHIIKQWNGVIKKAHHQVWVLGDMCIKNKLYDFDSIISRLKGTIHVITGNHCYLPAYSKIHVANGILKKYGFWLSHYPIHPQELRGKKNIHGHIHGIENLLKDDRYINVNCEFINYTPISLEQIRANNCTKEPK